MFRVIGATITDGALGHGDGRDCIRAHETRKVLPTVQHRFGGSWTERKLEALREYLESYWDSALEAFKEATDAASTEGDSR